MSPIRFECDECGRKISAPDEAAGTDGTCPQCGEVLEIPEESTRKSSKGSETRQIKSPGGRRRRGRGGRGRRGGGEQGPREPEMQAWHVVLIVLGVTVGLGSLIFAMTRGSSEPEDTPVVRRSSERETDPSTEEGSDGGGSVNDESEADDARPGDKKQPADEKKKKKKKKVPKDLVKAIAYTVDAAASKQIEQTLVSGDERSVLGRITGMTARQAVPILLNAFRQVNLTSEDGNGKGNFIQSLLCEKSGLDEKAPVYDPHPNGVSSRGKCRKEWFQWYWKNKDSLQ